MGQKTEQTEADDRECSCKRELKECACDRKRPRVLRRFVTRGGELVEVERVVRETR